ncbi:MAG: Gfo/Idh/MocA family protein [Haloarculaceae archaeon]
MTTRTGYVGVDHHHRDPYLQVAGRLPVDLVAVCEPGEAYAPEDVQPMADRPDEITSEGADLSAVLSGVETYADPHRLLREADVDAVWITYANDEVPAIVDTAVEAGVDVLSEKPLARTAADLEPVLGRASDAGVTVGVTYFYRWNPVVQELRSMVEAGAFGDLWSVDGRYVASKLDYRDTDHYVYRADRSRGGALQWVGLHWVDLFMYVLDEPIVRVSAQQALADHDAVDEGLTMQFETDSGVMGTFQTGYYLGRLGKDTRLALYGDRLTGDSPVHHDARAGGDGTVDLSLYSDHPDWGGAPGRTRSFAFGYDRFPAWGDYVLDFFADYFADYFANRDSGAVPADGDDALCVLRVLDAAYEAAERGEWVPV